MDDDAIIQIWPSWVKKVAFMGEEIEQRWNGMKWKQTLDDLFPHSEIVGFAVAAPTYALYSKRGRTLKAPQPPEKVSEGAISLQHWFYCGASRE